MNLQWNQSPCYWIGVVCRAGANPAAQQAFKQIGMEPGPLLETGTWLKKAPRQWGVAWTEVYNLLAQHNLIGSAEALVVPGENPPGAEQVQMARISVERVQTIATNLWLGEALMSNNVLCYLQPVVSAKDKIFGYESFARVRQADGTIIGGGAIVAASRALGIEYAIDRQLQIQSIKTFVSSDRTGSLFINFFPGFIQRPEVYLEGLTETVRAQRIVPKHIILDMTRSDDARDIRHLKRISEYCKSKGYAVALDDIESTQNIKMLLGEIRPDFVKLDMRLVHKIGESAQREMIRQITEFCHASGAMVVAEGVETEDMYTRLKEMDVDLFQGYLFSPPMPVESLAMPKVAG